MLGFFKKAVSKDLVEAVLAASVYMASKQGGFTQAKIDQLKVSVASNKDLAAFNQQEISAIIERFATNITNSPRAAKMAIQKEIQEGATTPDRAKMIFLTMLDVADIGGLDEEEKVTAREVAGWIGITNLAEYDL